MLLVRCRQLSNITSLLIVAFMLNITSPMMYSQMLLERTQAGFKAVGQAIKDVGIGKLQEMGRSAAATVNASLKNKLTQLSGMAPKVIIPKLLETLEEFGKKVDYIANCMISGENCSSQERAAFIASTVLILALTATLIGFTIGTAATSQQVEEQMVKISGEAKGWSPKAVFIRLANTVTQFKQNLLTMQTCLLKQQCTKTQKNILYATAGSIAGLALIAVGAGVGALIYEQYKKDQREAAARAAQTAPGIKPTPEKPIEGPLAQEEKKSGPIATIQAQAKTKIAQLQELAKDWKSKITDTVTPMQEYFQRQVIEKGTSTVQKTATQIQELLTEQVKTAQQALKETAQDIQIKLAEKAQATHEKAKELAQQFLNELEAKGSSLLDAATQEVLNIKITYIEPALQKIQEYTDRVVKAINPLANVRLKGQILKITDDINVLIDKAKALQGKWKETLSQLVERPTWKKSHIRPTWAGGKTNEQIEEEATTLFPLAYTADDVWNFYPQLVASVNDLKLTGPAYIIESFLRLSAQLLEWVQALNSAAGKVGKVIISKELADALQELRGQLVQLGTDIKDTLRIKPILSNPPQSTSQALVELFKGYTWRVGTGLPGQMNDYITHISSLYNDTIAPAIQTITEQNNLLMKHISNITTDLQKELIVRIKESPLNNSARTPIILAQTFGTIVSKVKGTINEILTKTGTVIEAVSTILDDAKPMGELINSAIGGDFINTALISGLKKITDNIHAIRQTISKMQRGVTESIKIPANI